MQPHWKIVNGIVKQNQKSRNYYKNTKIETLYFPIPSDFRKDLVDTNSMFGFVLNKKYDIEKNEQYLEKKLDGMRRKKL